MSQGRGLCTFRQVYLTFAVFVNTFDLFPWSSLIGCVPFCLGC